MTTDTMIESQTATEAEVAAAQAEAIEAIRKQNFKTGQVVESGKELPGTLKPMAYRIDPADEAAWVMVWELEVDANGQEYGTPRKAPRQQLGLWLQKRREFDGGIRFTVNQPSRVRAEAPYLCLEQKCKKRLYTRLDLVDHTENAHPRTARLQRKLLDQILDQAATENPRVQQLAEAYRTIPERGIVSVEVNPEPRQEKLDLTAGAVVTTTLSGLPLRTEPVASDMPEIFWCRKGDCKRFFDNESGRNAHEYKPH